MSGRTQTKAAVSVRATQRPAASSGLRFYKLDIDRDRHLVANQNAACLQGRVPDQAKIFPVDPGGGGNSEPSVAPWVLDGSAGTLDLKYHVTSDAVDGKVT